jgi:hypothetical protein
MMTTIESIDRTLQAGGRPNATPLRRAGRKDKDRWAKVFYGKEGILFAVILLVLWQVIAEVSHQKLRFLFPSLPVVAGALWISRRAPGRRF